MDTTFASSATAQHELGAVLAARARWLARRRAAKREMVRARDVGRALRATRTRESRADRSRRRTHGREVMPNLRSELDKAINAAKAAEQAQEAKAVLVATDDAMRDGTVTREQLHAAISA